MIELRDLTKRYGEKTAVDGLSFTVHPGIVTGFLGPNGAGKSTTMRMVLGLDAPTHGHVRIDGQPYDHTREPLHSVGALLEAKGVHPGRTAYNHLLCMAQSNGIPERRVGEVLEMVGLQDVARKRPKGFSLGMGQRLGIAGALLGDPRILMFDEPVNGLDPEGIHWIRTLMQHLAREGRTVFVSSHLMSEMAQTAQHLVVIGQGRLLADTSMSQFISENSRTHVRIRTPEPERLQDVLTAEGLRPVAGHEGALEVEDGDAARIGELAASHGVVLHELSPQRASLEEAFMRLTAQSVEYHAFAPPDNDSATPGGGPAGPSGPGGPAGPSGSAGPSGPAEGGPGWGQSWKKGGQG
ncbi:MULTISPECIES: ATP-binding cassette domain-containing protein [unclassified Streptomyces]|uniref:ABC transporter ATP-binding protein n=1 Tax=unclassified Streptomyces TaxID=2593676 RepID=UPI002DDA2D2F|nr:MULTISPECIES: ATP-binding cassette domain-containing protein [unclassified Streptomyces]WSA92299.1 ATP-binding cassette domain-containing protein [Streptomyces sp. NBC_01795]WSB76668.1 ATP-binding cassette domain-containing protein [Streptomyces sp. NBC_01775]WSS43888.1 ATP-binding cassette domain-containing protein [Streptomyces sp. NBC_01187]